MNTAITILLFSIVVLGGGDLPVRPIFPVLAMTVVRKCVTLNNLVPPLALLLSPGAK